ncbi:MAG: hypothetical protein H6920_00040 [Sphingomonadaceae bacterium]|nr:hypothetical protein [Gammaproteobacteria bacterium]MCP5390004.1 hypothetical protein [Sphingomonadaceae bacterium]
MERVAIHLRTTSARQADAELVPLQHQRTVLQAGDDHVEITWGAQDVRFGAIETTFELIGALVVLGGVSVKVASTLLTKWLWSKIEAAQKANSSPKPAFEAEIQLGNATSVKISAHTEAELQRSIETVLRSAREDT